MAFGRCQRMNKTCQPSPPMRKRRVGPIQRESKTSKLEEKVDGLVTLLKSATQGAHGFIQSTSTASPPEVSVFQSSEDALSSIDTDRVSHQGHPHGTSLSNGKGFSMSDLTPQASRASASPSELLQPVLPPALEPSQEDAERYLNRFRTDYVKHLPFITLSQSLTAHQLRQERPILWVCIMAATSTHTSQQIGLSKEVRAIFGREAYVEGNRNMDFLLAVLVYAAW